MLNYIKKYKKKLIFFLKSYIIKFITQKYLKCYHVKDYIQKMKSQKHFF